MRGLGILCSTGVLLSAGLFAGSQATATARSGPDSVLAAGRPGHAVTVTVVVPEGVGGVISQMVVVGRPGTTPEVGPSEDRLPPTAVERVANELDSVTSFTYTSLSARVTPTTPGTYPVFTFASRDLGCGSSNMAEPHDLTITRVGLLRVT
jgi:hypothetical protein